MTYFTYIMNTLFAALSLLIASGVAVHDGHFGHAIDISLTHDHSMQKLSSQDLRTINESRMQHTHSEHNLSEGMLSNSFRYQSPSISPDRRHHHKNILALLEEGGRHAFDNANLPVID